MQMLYQYLNIFQHFFVNDVIQVEFFRNMA